MAFDAGAIVGKMKLDTGDFDSSARMIQGKVASMGDAVYRAGQQMVSVSRSIQMVGRNLTFLGAGVVTPMIVAFKSAEKYSNSVRIEMERLNSVTIQMRTSVAESLVPVMHQLSNVLGDLLQRWNNLSPAMRQSILQTTFIIGEWTLLGGLALSIASKIGQLIGRLVEFSSALFKFAALNPELTLTVIALTAIGVVITKLAGLNPVLNALEKFGLMIAKNWTIAAIAALQFSYAFYAVTDPFNKWAAGIKKANEQMTAGLMLALDQINEKLANLGKGKDGALVGFVDDVKSKVETVKGLFSNLGKTDFHIPDKIYEASKTFAEGWHDAIEDANHSLHDWGAMAKSIVDQTTQEMQSAFSNLFQNVLKGQLNSAKDFFVEWGNFVLKIISDVIAQIITAKIVGAAMGLFNFGTSYTANIAGMGTVPVAPPNYYLGHDEGIDRVPETGTYKLHAGERVVPKYDANKTESQPIIIYNVLSSDAIAAAMSGKEGRGVIVNVINQNSLRNGVVRREVVKR